MRSMSVTGVAQKLWTILPTSLNFMASYAGAHMILVLAKETEDFSTRPFQVQLTLKHVPVP